MVENIITHFKETIDKTEFWRVFWIKNGNNMRHVKEFYSQMLFFVVCETWLVSQSSNLKLTREFSHTTKQLDFRFTISDKNSVCVQVKHANGNGLETCYGKQALFYHTAKNTQGFYIVINFQDKISSQLIEIQANQKKSCKIIEISMQCKENSGDFIEFEGEENDLYIEEKRKGAKARHSKTDIIKNEIIKLMFVNKGLIKGLTVQQRADKIHTELANIYNAVLQKHNADIDTSSKIFICKSKKVLAKGFY